MTWKITTQDNRGPGWAASGATLHYLRVEFFWRPAHSVRVETANLVSIFPAEC